MKRGKGGQSANEAALIVIFLTFVMIVAIAAVSDDIIQASDNNYRALLQDIADVIESEAIIAFASENGYTHSFTLPQTLNGQPYMISIMNSTQIGSQANTTILSVASTRPNVHLNVTRLLPRDVIGNLVVGPNTVRKEQGIVTLMALPLPPPVVSSVSPSSGTTLGDTSVTIYGNDFVNTPTVTFGGAAASVTSSNSNTINVVTPAHAAGAVNVVVTNPDGQSVTLFNGFTYVAPPSITSITPDSGSTAGGTAVVISGSGFGATVSVSFGGAPWTVTPSNPSTINVVTPAHAAGAVNVVVTNPDGQSFTLNDGFTYVPPPSITSITPNSGSTAGGTPITIVGDYFQSGLSVVIGTSVAAGVVVSPDGKTITATTSSSVTAGAKDVTVTNPDGQFYTLPSAFTYVFPPSITSVSPPNGQYTGGTSVTITGSNFVSGAAVTFGGVASASVTFVSSTQLTAVSPAHAAGDVNVVVTNPDLQFGTLVNGFTYVLPPPSITSINPTSGSTAGGTIVNIYGSNFVSGAGVTFGGDAFPSPTVTFKNTGWLQAVAPAHVAGPVNVAVTNPDLQFSTQPITFMYLKANGEQCSSGSECVSGNCYVDADGDRYAPGSGTKTCRAQTQLPGTDCDDTNIAKYRLLTCYYDGDSDSYTVSSGTSRCKGASCSTPADSYKPLSSPLDCYDSNANAKPGQTGYFTAHRGDGSFDYNCDGIQTKLINCIRTFGGTIPCTNTMPAGTGGYVTGIPACGVSGNYMYCAAYYTGGCSLGKKFNWCGPCYTDGLRKYWNVRQTPSQVQQCN